VSAPWLVYPTGVNWFYERAAHDIRDDLRSHGISAELCGASELVSHSAPPAGGTVLIVSVGECVASLDTPGDTEPFVRRLRGFADRILVNYDCIYTEWFRQHFSFSPDLITCIADVNAVPQTRGASLRGLPYRWIPESLTAQERSSLQDWTPGRPVPWAIAGHATASRAAFLDAAVRYLAPGGFAFLPPHRAYRKETGTIAGAGLDRILSQADIYLWSSHHDHAFHECLRAPHAIRNGAIPAKIDPVFSDRFEGVPWVFRDLTMLRERIESEGLRGLYERCRGFLLGQGDLGDHFAKLLVPQGSAAVAS
jgi:hypothetical protein